MFDWILKILFRKDRKEMAIVYATLIIKGKKNYADVPARIKEAVAEILVALDCADLVDTAE